MFQSSSPWQHPDSVEHNSPVDTSGEHEEQQQSDWSSTMSDDSRALSDVNDAMTDSRGSAFGPAHDVQAGDDSFLNYGDSP